MQFVLQKNSRLSVHTQIKEQIKIALLLGNLRPGEILPSIRDLEKELGVSRNIVRKAYLELEELGILKMIQGKGVMVNKNLNYKKDKDFLQKCENLAEDARKSCESMGLILSSFATFLFHKAIEAEQEEAPLLYVDMSSNLARERSDQISKVLHIKVQGLSTEELKDLNERNKLRSGIKIICNYYRFDQVCDLLRGKKVDIVPLRMILGEKTKKELNNLPIGSKVLFIFDKQDQSGLSLILEDYRKTFQDQKLEFVSRSVNDLNKMIKTDGFAKIVVSNRIWNSIPKNIQKLSKVSHPVMEFDPSSLEESKLELGIIA